MLPSPSSAVIFKRLDDGAVAYDSAAEVYYGLNDVAARIWELLDGADVTLDALVAALRAEYPEADDARLRADASALIASLAEHGLVQARVRASA